MSGPAGPDPEGLPARPPALLIRGGHLCTADAEARVHPTGSVLVVDDRIAAVGPDGDVAEAVARLTPGQRAGLRTLDARSMLVMPGFVNNHWHDLFAVRLPFKGALRTPQDQADEPGFMALGGDIAKVSGGFEGFRRLTDALEPEEARAVARYALWTQLRSGTTTLGDVGSVNRPEALADAALDLGIRCSVSAWVGDIHCGPGTTSPERTRDTDTELERTRRLLDRCAADRTGRLRAWPTAPYLTNISDELGRGLAALSAEYGVPFATHVGALRHEADAVRAHFGTTPLRRLDRLGLLNDRLMAVHCAFADAEERRMLLDAGVHISHSPAKYGPNGESALTETGLIPELRRSGLDVSLSTDGGVFPVMGMAEEMRAAWQMYNEMAADHTTLPASEALAMATRIAARGLGWEHEVGSLEAGKQADLVLVPVDDWRYLLNPRPLEAYLALGGTRDVHTVLVAGRVLLENGRTPHLDEDALRDAYLRALRSFSARALGVAEKDLTALFDDNPRPPARASTVPA
ncbi:amidohydrolase family protein [Streptomyces halstedii]|uniref:amidohydrolase family protein n=1 Tax=Streptomyces TaxID=1883 RepID=UPI0004A8E9B0|nr:MULTISPECIES: amidohydrolase family protein [Streptomyces]WSX35448.1 amidohydrolase family protein [Streptomyces halstedii]KDQ70109.1 amidohydrolase [Streptomyces sp. NTK 937]SBU95396.1 Cytosine/adenosine deaminase [Streptomyces sp. OspMP-M45]SCD68907.1 Cytosine/adenosine deaminase [Streptomyces sp. DpondAA-D4]SCE39020.1 Cytosine/adenosine deaminase [Streptomyces sp. PpalLS-921]